MPKTTWEADSESSGEDGESEEQEITLTNGKKVSGEASVNLGCGGRVWGLGFRIR
jgi:hypothetical protein